MEDIRAKIERANQKVINILLEGQPVWIGDEILSNAIPDLAKDTILHAGPPIEWGRMARAMRNAILGAVVFEGLTDDFKEAEKMVSMGNVNLEPCHNYPIVGGMTGVTSPSMFVHVVRNETFGNTAYCMPHEGGSFKGLGWGTNDEETLNHIRWMQDELSPVLSEAVREMGGINIKQLIARALQMGDECHSRCTAATLILARKLAPHMVKLDYPANVLERAFSFLRTHDIFALHIIMAAARALVDPAKNIPYSTIVTTLARNGVDFGIKISSLGDKWFIAKSPTIKTAFFSPQWNDKVATPDMGDSSITETVGLGGQIPIAAVAHEHLLGGDYHSARKKTENSYGIAFSEHNEWFIPNLNFRGAPVGIDMRKVLNTGIEPSVHTATAHIDGGFIGGGESYVPMETFESAMRKFAKQYRLS